MNKWRTHTPEGAFDILESECALKRYIENKVSEVYVSSGYFEIQTPIFEFYDVFAGEGTNTDHASTFKFFDRQGRILVLRPDFTVPVARVCATKYKPSDFPKRVSYVGSAFREGNTVAGALQKQFTQAGVEFIGKGTPEADAEVIALTIRALLACGLTDFQIDLGQAEFFKGIMQQTGLSGSRAEQVRALTDQKNIAGLTCLIDKYNITGEMNDLIAKLPNLFGSVNVALQIKEKDIGERASKALDNLIEIYSILKDYGLEKYIAVDLGMVQGLSYYTGVIVKGNARGVGFSICGGGRYDSLIGEFGKNLPATGIAIGIERIISALPDEKSKIYLPAVDTIVCYESSRETAYKISEGLRKSGLIVIMQEYSDTVYDFARKRKIGGIVKVKDKEKIEVIDLKTGETTKTTIATLLGGAVK